MWGGPPWGWWLWGPSSIIPSPVLPRSCSLVQVNSMLREQLEQANVANAALSEDIRKLTADWARARGELEQREAQWRREEEVREMQSRGVLHGDLRRRDASLGGGAWGRTWCCPDASGLQSGVTGICSIHPHPIAVLQHLLQQRARPPAHPLEAGCGLPPPLRPAASCH